MYPRSPVVRSARQKEKIILTVKPAGLDIGYEA